MARRATGNPPGNPNLKARPLLPIGDKPDLPDHQWRALQIEFQWLSYQRLFKERWPSRATLSMVAKAANTTRAAVQKWRRDDRYRRGLYWLIGQKLTTSMAGDNRGEKISTTPINESYLLGESWPVKSPLDGKMYERDAYVAHVLSFSGIVGFTEEDNGRPF